MVTFQTLEEDDFLGGGEKGDVFGEGDNEEE